MEGVSQRSRGQWQCPLGHSPALHQPSSMSLSVQRRASSSGHLCRGWWCLVGQDGNFSRETGGPAYQGRELGRSTPGGSEGTPPQTPHFMPTDTIELDIRGCVSSCQTPTEFIATSKRLIATSKPQSEEWKVTCCEKDLCNGWSE